MGEGRPTRSVPSVQRELILSRTIHCLSFPAAVKPRSPNPLFSFRCTGSVHCLQQADRIGCNNRSAPDRASRPATSGVRALMVVHATSCCTRLSR
ncbi:hypothetical protein BaRGS_00007009 [Batillaria attramentaria]|uniref:Uncharacterized protein n=1 Tax=Batillaria attramentaria TaxID=370345 RepID=A0ABD0LQ10_9CAEN